MTLPDTVKVPVGHRVVMETTATGEITCECRVKKDRAFPSEWLFIGPGTGLRDRAGHPVGKYHGPPATWESNDGSKVAAAQLAVAPNGTGNIPRQLVKANADMGTGKMQGVSPIRRVATQGGVVPASACKVANAAQKMTLPYRADCIFLGSCLSQVVD